MLGALPGVVGALQATEVLKFLLGRGESLAGRLVLYDALAMEFRTLRLRRDADCPACGESPSLRHPGDLAVVAERETPDAAAEGAAPATGGDGDFPMRVEAEALRDLLQGDPAPVLLDVREGWEVRMGALPGALHIPLGDLPARWRELPEDRDVVVYCHRGVRSWEAMQFLRGAGLPGVASLDGGCDAWSLEVDPSLPRY